MTNTLHLKSLIAPGDPPVRVMRAYHTTISSHNHDFYELVYVTDGFCVHDSAGSVSLLMEGDIFILKPYVSHKYSGNRVTHIYNCLFGREAAGEQLEALSRLPGLDRLFSPDPAAGVPVLHLTLSERKTFQQLISWMHEECETRPAGWDVRVKSLLNCLLVEYARAYLAHLGSDTEFDAYSAYVSRAIGYIDMHYGRFGLTVREIAAQAGVSGDYLSRQFRRVTGIGVQEYLRRYRFARSMELLQAGKPVSEAARETGFQSLCHFSREFRREIGVTPSQYREQRD